MVWISKCLMEVIQNQKTISHTFFFRRGMSLYRKCTKWMKIVPFHKISRVYKSGKRVTRHKSATPFCLVSTIKQEYAPELPVSDSPKHMGCNVQRRTHTELQLKVCYVKTCQGLLIKLLKNIYRSRCSKHNALCSRNVSDQKRNWIRGRWIGIWTLCQLCK